MDVREWFRSAAQGFVDLLPATEGRLDAPGLGDWDVRALVGHTTRAFLTIETYLAEGHGEQTGQPSLSSPGEYFRGARAGLADPAQVTQRAVDAGRALGDSPQQAARQLAERVMQLVADTPDDAVARTPLGDMVLIDYLPTRAFELTVHGLDLASACDQAPPESLLRALPACLALCAEIANSDQQLSLVLAATGRGPLPQPFSVL